MLQRTHRETFSCMQTKTLFLCSRTINKHMFINFCYSSQDCCTLLFPRKIHALFLHRHSEPEQHETVSKIMQCLHTFTQCWFLGYSRRTCRLTSLLSRKAQATTAIVSVHFAADCRHPVGQERTRVIELQFSDSLMTCVHMYMHACISTKSLWLFRE